MIKRTIKITIFGIALLVMLAMPAMASEIVLAPLDSSVDNYHDSTTVEIWAYLSDPCIGGAIDLRYLPECANVTNFEPNEVDWVWGFTWDSSVAGKEWITFLHSSANTGNVLIGTFTIRSETDVGMTPLFYIIGYSNSALSSEAFTPLENVSWINGTFTCGAIQTFSRELPAGWNLISLPLTPTDNSTGTVLSTVTYNAVKQYNAVTKQFETATTMDPGTGYFVHVTAASTWEYMGESASPTTTQLKSGLNMIGVPNCAVSVSDAMGSTDYRYAARWNTTSQSYEVYNPNAPAEFHGFTTMTAGEGYFISARSNSELIVACL